MIDKRNGHISISFGAELAPNDSLEKYRNLKLGESQEIRDMKTGWKWLYLSNVQFDNEYFIFRIGFFNDKLKLLDFVVKQNAFDLSDPWTGCEEKHYQSFLKKWLANELGREGQYHWGHISVSEDSKVGGYSIFVNYQLTAGGSWLDKMKNHLGHSE